MTASQEQDKGFEEIELGPIHPVVVVAPLPGHLSQNGDQNVPARRIVTEEEAEEHTAYAYRTSLKWRILAALWMVGPIIESSQSTEPLRRPCVKLDDLEMAGLCHLL